VRARPSCVGASGSQLPPAPVLTAAAGTLIYDRAQPAHAEKIAPAATASIASTAPGTPNTASESVAPAPCGRASGRAAQAPTDRRTPRDYRPSPTRRSPRRPRDSRLWMSFIRREERAAQAVEQEARAEAAAR